MITADTVTDEQIRKLRAETRARLPRTKHESRSEALGIVETCMLALNESPLQTRADVHARARAHCAEILNARTVNVMNGGTAYPPDDRTPAQVAADARAKESR